MTAVLLLTKVERERAAEKDGEGEGERELQRKRGRGRERERPAEKDSEGGRERAVPCGGNHSVEIAFGFRDDFVIGEWEDRIGVVVVNLRREGLALSRQIGEAWIFSAPKLTELHRTPSM